MGVLGPGAGSGVRVSERTPTKGSNSVRFFSKMMLTLTFIPEVCVKWTQHQVRWKASVPGHLQLLIQEVVVFSVCLKDHWHGKQFIYL